MPIIINTAGKMVNYPLHWNVSMHTPIFNILSHIHKQGFDFFGYQPSPLVNKAVVEFRPSSKPD